MRDAERGISSRMGSGWTSYFTAQGDQGNAGGRVVGTETWNGPTPSSSVQPQALLLHGRHTLYKVATLQAMGLLDTTTARNTALSPPGVRWMTLPRWAVKIPAAGHKH